MTSADRWTRSGGPVGAGGRPCRATGLRNGQDVCVRMSLTVACTSPIMSPLRVLALTPISHQVFVLGLRKIRVMDTV